MAMYVKKISDSATKSAFLKKLADIPGGVSIVGAELVQDYIPEGTPISKPDSNGKSHVVKFALVQANATDAATKIKIYKGHNFKIGDVVCAGESSSAYAITAISTSNTAYDELTVGTTLGVALTADTSYIFEASTSGASGSVLKYQPFALVGTGKKVEGNIDTDAVVFALTKGNVLPSLIAGKLSGIINL